MSQRPSSAFDDAVVVVGLVALPLLVSYVAVALTYHDGALVVPGAAFVAHVGVPGARAFGLYLGWFLLQLGLAVILPARAALGVPLEDGRALPYRLNGWRAFVVTLALAAALVLGGVLPARILYDEFLPLALVANLFSFAFCVFLLVIGRRQATAAERQRSTLSAFFHGAALNPRTAGFDWKFFCESRPSMILWVLIDLSCAAAQLQRDGALSSSMILVCGFQLFYVADYFFLEDAILTTWDIRHEAFGFMLCWGVLVFIPFTFSLQAVYLATHPVHLHPAAIAGLCVLNFGGYYIFRTANLQKHRFRSDPERPIWGQPPAFITTQLGTRLLTSGFWGYARHANYLGDLMMGLAWCLCTGYGRAIPYFYIAYFVILLVHRERRDQAHCAAKYGDEWTAYEKKVPWRIVPWLY